LQQQKRLYLIAPHPNILATNFFSDERDKTRQQTRPQKEETILIKFEDEPLK